MLSRGAAVRGVKRTNLPGSNGGAADAEKVAAMSPDIVTFNGRAFQYDAHPLKLGKGQRVRIWVLDAGPKRCPRHPAVS